MILLALAVLAANPTTLQSVINGAKPGDTIRLVAGRYPQIKVKNRTWNPPLTVDATLADGLGVALSGTSGFTWHGGSLTGVSTAGGTAVGYGFTADWNSKNITIYGVTVSNYKLGIGFDRVNGGRIADNWLSKMSSDGIDVSLSRNVVVDHNACTDFKPSTAAHPDCIQLWSRPTMPPTADITISNNSAVGAMQGIGMFNHVRDGVDDGGYDRIIVRGNTVLNLYAQGIAVTSCRGCTVRDNKVGSLPNYVNKAQLRISGNTSLKNCGNTNTAIPSQSTPPCVD